MDALLKKHTVTYDKADNMSKKLKKKLKLSKQQFKCVVCSNCTICSHKPSLEFCFNVYEDNPKEFITSTFVKLTKLVKWVDDPTNETKIFTDLFCKYTCNSMLQGEEDCPSVEYCLEEFKKQVPSKVKPVEKYIAKPYPTFFCSDKEFELEILQLLRGNDYATNHKQPDNS